MNKFFSKISPKNIAIIFLIAIFFITDRYLKLVALSLPSNNSHQLLGKFFAFTFTPNYYMAFSLPVGGDILTGIILTVIIGLLLLIFYLIINKKTPNYLPLLLTIILFGAISNILDRLIYGYVVDYFELQYFSVFNIADAMISLGSILIIIRSLKK